MKQFDKLKGKLAELFQLDQADLDFGIYRIMNARRDEISQFMEQDLLPQVHEAFSQYASCDKAEIQNELDEAIQQAKTLGADPDTLPKVKELRAKLDDEAVDLTALENEVYSRLYDFFNRYYEEGDFISLRRYKEGVYAIPYEGEEVKLHWANSDQYYIKTTENFRDYAFKTADGHRVHFKIVEADTEKDNIKAAKGKDRRFVLCGEDPVAEADGELIIRFEYRPDGENRKQDAISTETVQQVIESLNGEELAAWQHRLGVNWVRADGTASERTILQKHLSDYTKRNTFDYFIHKDLDGFLRRELDFYIKNEVMHLDDVENESAPRVEQYLSKIKVIRQIAHKIIGFLAQIENFQKKLWLKKKFVIETNYCITLDRVPEELYEEIAANDSQREEWVKLFAIDEIKAEKLGDVAYAEPLTVEFLKANPFLMLDTKFFSREFKDRLLGSIDDIEGKCDGLLIRSENFQSLRLLQQRYHEQVKCVYIDPPYNSDAGPISYKNGYRHSSWMSLVGNRLEAVSELLCSDAITCVTIDDYEAHRLRTLFEYVYPSASVLGIVPIKNNPAGRTGTKGFSICHEYAFFYGHSDDAVVSRLDHSEEQKARYKEKDELGFFEWTNFRKHGGLNTYRDARPRQFYPIYVKGTKIRIPEMTWDNELRKYIVNDPPCEGEETLWPIDSKQRERIWDFVISTAKQNIEHLMVKKDAKGNTAVYRKWRINDQGLLPQTWWDKSEYSAAEYGTNLLAHIFGETHAFMFPKSVLAVADSLKVCGLRDTIDGLALDYFAGSGTTGHAIIDLNRDDGGKRKYVLVEMGDYFDTVLKPRIQKVVYAREWKNGKPQELPIYLASLKKKLNDAKKALKEIKGIENPDEYEFEKQKFVGKIEELISRIKRIEGMLATGDNPRFGVSHCFKCIRLESYEDALANIRLRRTETQQSLLDGSDSFRESYMLGYMLDTEATGSASLLNIDAFEDPFNYKLLVGTGSVGETKPVNVDLIETFNWLLGLRVRHMSHIRGIRVVEGENPKGEKVLVIWRNVKETSNDDIEEFFKKQQYNTLDMEFDLVYVNGDNNLMNIPVVPEEEGSEPNYKVRLIEEEFKRLMFDVKDV